MCNALFTLMDLHTRHFHAVSLFNSTVCQDNAVKDVTHDGKRDSLAHVSSLPQGGS